VTQGHDDPRPASPEARSPEGWRIPWAAVTALFLGSFAWSFVHVSLPFYITAISTVDPATTLQWSGWILGVTSLVTVATAPVWGRMAGHVSPRTLWFLTELLQGLGFFFMALARTLPELLLARTVLGLMGAASTLAFILAGRRGTSVRRDVSAMQSGLTVGQILGPLPGAVIAARVGFVTSFVIGGLVLWACAALVWIAIPREPPPPPDARRARPTSIREVALAALVVLVGSMQIFFLTAILPETLPRLGVAAPDTLEVGGVIIFVSGLAAALGAVAAPRLAELGEERLVVPWLLGGSSLCLAAFGLAPGALSFGVLRFLQVLCVAPVFPLAVAAIAQTASGQAIGFVNSARIGAAFLGPVAATTVLARGTPALVYLALGATGFAVLPVLLLRRRSRP
jgi:MFS family permease